ncbi:MAG TPA: HAD hydrolase-like protein [Methanocorpusculum sp.]|nr:HAD hydrolase-like protein [Methanocorpusculum sp.]
MYALCIFDLDGTLLDTIDGLLDSINYTMEKHGASPLQRSELKRLMGTPIQDIFRIVYHLEGQENADAVEIFRNHNRDNPGCVSVYPGMDELLSDLQKAGCRVALSTMKPKETAERMLIDAGLIQYFDLVMGKGDNAAVSKASMVNDALSSFHLSPSEAVFVGDSEHDRLGAEMTGIDFVGVTYGYGFCEDSDVTKGYHRAAAENASDVRSVLFGKK